MLYISSYCLTMIEPRLQGEIANTTVFNLTMEDDTKTEQILEDRFYDIIILKKDLLS